jgi:hypothetical protein
LTIAAFSNDEETSQPQNRAGLLGYRAYDIARRKMRLKAADLPFEQTANAKLLINLKTALRTKFDSMIT